MDKQRVPVGNIILSACAVKDYRPVVAMIYKTECLDFLNKCHKAAGGLVECVDDMCSTISEGSDFYAVNLDRETIGYFVKADLDDVIVLEGFHIRKGCRNPPIIQAFWDLVRLALGAEFYIGILQGNTPAEKHLLRNGFELIDVLEERGKRFNLFKNKII